MNINKFKKLSRIKPKNDPYAEYDEPIKAEKWRNILFDKSGKSYRGHLLHDTEEQALRASIEADVHDGTYYPTVDGDIMDSDYSHTIQMPVKP